MQPEPRQKILETIPREKLILEPIGKQIQNTTSETECLKQAEKASSNSYGFYFFSGLLVLSAGYYLYKKYG
jgi:hypothetical protein